MTTARGSRWTAADLQEVPACPACGGARRTVMHPALADRLAPGDGTRWTLHRCERSRAAWLDPRPADDAIGKAYGSGYHTHEPPRDDAWVRGRGLAVAVRPGLAEELVMTARAPG